MKLLPCREGKFIGHRCFTTNYDYSNIYLLLSRQFMEEDNFHPSDYDSLKFNESLALASDKTNVKNQFNLSKLSTIFQRIRYQNNVPISSLIIIESESLYILSLIIFFFFNLPLFSIIRVKLRILMFRSRFLLHASLWSLEEYRLKKLPYQHDETEYQNVVFISHYALYLFLHFQSPSNPCKVETFEDYFHSS